MEMETDDHTTTAVSKHRQPDSRKSSADTPITHAEFVMAMRYLWAALGRTKDPDEITLAAWFDNLNDLSKEQIQTGMRRFIRECSAEFVSVQKIRELSGAVLNHEAAAMLAWDAVIDAIRIWGSYQVPKFSDYVTSHVVRHLGGWVEICGTEPTQLRQWTRQQFVKAYKSLASVVNGPAELKCLIHDAARPTVAQIEQRAAAVRNLIEAPTEAVKLELHEDDRLLLKVAMERRADGIRIQ